MIKNIINKLKTKKFIKYTISSGICFSIDLLLFTLFTSIFKSRIDLYIFISTFLARFISSVINYIINKKYVFAGIKNKNQLIKFILLVIIQLFTSAYLVNLVHSFISINETIIKFFIDLCIFVVNFIIQKYLIFGTTNINFEKYKKITLIISSLCLSFTLLYKINKTGIDVNLKDNNVFYMFILTTIIYFFYKQNTIIKKNETLKIPAIIFTLLLVFGYSYDTIGTSDLVTGSPFHIFLSIVKFIGLYNILNLFLNKIYAFFKSYKPKKLKSSKIIDMFNKHPFIFSFITILICYLPYIIVFYPIVLNPDAANQIREIMGIETRYLSSIVLLDNNVTITNFNPVLHTLLLGGLFKLGHILGNDNFGLFLYTIVQITIVISTFSYTICYMKKQGVKTLYLFITLIAVSLIPLFPQYAMTGVKDVIFSSLMLLFFIKTFDIIKNNQTFKDYIYYTIILILVFLFRNNGIYTIAMSLPILIIVIKKYRKPLIIILIVVLCSYTSYNKILTYLNIPNTSIREALSIPFQQTARYVTYYDNEVENSDKIIIDKLLIYDTLKERYNPALSDPVKNRYNRYATNDDLKAYFQVWFKYLLKRPVTYINATIDNVYGYFYPNTSKGYIYNGFNTALKDEGFNYSFNGLTLPRTILKQYGNAFPFIPVIGLTSNIGFIVWTYIYMIFLLIIENKKKYITILIPSLILVLTCVAGPVNTYFRYITPLAFILFPMIFLIKNEIE